MTKEVQGGRKDWTCRHSSVEAVKHIDLKLDNLARIKGRRSTNLNSVVELLWYSSAPEAPHLQLPQYRMIIDARKKNPHCISAIVQEGDASSIQIAG